MMISSNGNISPLLAICAIPWNCYERSLSELYLSIWNQLASVVCSVTAAIFIDFCLKQLNVLSQHIAKQERLKGRNTLGCLDQYAAQNSKHARPPIPSQPPRSSFSDTLKMIPPWNIHTVKQSMPRNCSNGCSLNWFTPSEFFKFSQLTI